MPNDLLNRIVARLMTPAGPGEAPGGLLYWRQRIFLAVLLPSLALAAILLPYTMFAYLIPQGRWFTSAANTTAFVLGLVAVFPNLLAFRWRVALVLIGFYLVSLNVLVTFGPLSAGLVWLFAFGVLAGVLLGLAGGLFALGLNLFTLTVMGFLIARGTLAWPTAGGDILKVWVVASANFAFLNGVVAVVVPVLTKGLGATVRREQDAHAALQKEGRLLNWEKARFQMLVEEIPLGLVLIRGDGVWEYMNPAFQGMIGYDLADIPNGKAWFKTAYPEPELRQEAMSAWLGDWKECGPGVARPRTFTVTRADGARREIHFRPVGLPNGDQLVLCEDISDWQKAEQERRMMAAQLQQAQKMEAIGTLAGGIAHDFNNILSAILGYCELTLPHLKPEGQAHQNLEHVMKAAERAAGLVRQILAFSRQERQERRPIKLAPVIKEAMKLLRASLPATVEFRLDIDSQAGLVLADPVAIHQLLMNLCTNAAQAMMPVPGVLEVSLKRGSEKPGRLADSSLFKWPWLELAVRDTGPGISPGIQERIFEPFFTTKEPGHGTGLGLAVAHGVVRGHGGEILVESAPGRGALFRVFLPLAKDARKPEPGLEPPQTGGGERILLVDDEPDLVEIGRKSLTALGYRVTASTSADNAMRIFRNTPKLFDLVVADLAMPGTTGLQLAEQINALHPRIPIIICTGFSDAVRPELVRPFGVREILHKPVVRRTLAEAVRRVLDQDREDDSPAS